VTSSWIVLKFVDCVADTIHQLYIMRSRHNSSTLQLMHCVKFVDCVEVRGLCDVELMNCFV